MVLHHSTLAVDFKQFQAQEKADLISGMKEKMKEMIDERVELQEDRMEDRIVTLSDKQEVRIEKVEEDLEEQEIAAEKDSERIWQRLNNYMNETDEKMAKTAD